MKNYIELKSQLGNTITFDPVNMGMIRRATNLSNGRTGDLLMHIAIESVRINGVSITEESYDNISIDDGIVIMEVIGNKLSKLSFK